MTETTLGRRSSDRRNRDSEVLQAAIKVFFEKGYAAASVQDVADVVGVLKGSLYHYISSKEDLLLRIFDGSHTQAVQIMEALASRNLPPRQWLESYLNEIVHWYLANIERVSLYFNEWHYLTGENAETVRKHRRVFSQYIRDILEAAPGDLRPGVDPRLATYFILGAVNNIPVWYKRNGPYSAARVASEYASMAVAVVFTEVAVV
jgi:AcrR family transcriptional regulator